MDTRYQRGKIYTIRNREDDNNIYVGSTIETLAQRLSKHRYSSKKDKGKNIKLYQNVNNDWDNWYIELYENHPCNSKEELEKREGEVIREIGTLNKIIAGRTHKEYYKDNKKHLLQKNKENYENNKEHYSKKSKEYRENNKQQILEKNKIYRENNKIDISERRKESYKINNELLKERARNYRKENVEKVKETDKKKYQKNKIILSAKGKEKVICECGCEINKNSLSYHNKSKKHFDLLKILTENIANPKVNL